MNPVIDPATAAQMNVSDEELARQLYDVLMAEIEPDLLLENIPQLDEKYKDETPEQKQERIKRYAEAYKQFDSAFNQFMGEVKAEARASRRESIEQEEDAIASDDASRLASLESNFE